MFTKFYIERIFYFFLLLWVVKRGLFSTFITRGLPVIAQSENFLLKGVSFYPSFSPFITKGYAGHACEPYPSPERKEHVMSKRKSRPTIVPWLSAKPDSYEKRFIQVGNSLVLSDQFQNLGIGTRYLYFCMAMESGGKRDFTFPQKVAEKYGIKPSSLRRHIDELEAGKFIKVYSGKPTREPNKYIFCQEWKLSCPPSACAPPMAIYSKSDPN